MNPSTHPAQDRRRFLCAGFLIGAGMGGFLDGIVFHQILQWHNMLSGWVPPVDEVTIKINMAWDGYFHLGVWLLTLAGIVLLWHSAAASGHRRSGAGLAGAMLAGWGVFNLVEGVINHHVLGLHRVHEYSSAGLLWDLGFLASGLVLLVVGLVLIGRSRTH